jgi:hypothetical protein
MQWEGFPSANLPASRLVKRAAGWVIGLTRCPPPLTVGLLSQRCGRPGGAGRDLHQFREGFNQIVELERLGQESLNPQLQGRNLGQLQVQHDPVRCCRANLLRIPRHAAQPAPPIVYLGQDGRRAAAGTCFDRHVTARLSSWRGPLPIVRHSRFWSTLMRLLTSFRASAMLSLLSLASLVLAGSAGYKWG